MNSNKLQYFEGIRGLAALIVVFDHLDFALSLNLDKKIFNLFYQLTASDLISNSFQSIFSFFLNGNLAVFIFFFMSGYVISIKLFTSESKSYLISAISKRYFRLMPPILGSVLIGFFLMKFDLIYNIKLAKVLGTEDALGYFYNFYPSFLSAFKSGVWNVLFTKSLGGYNGPLWTMRPEFYGSLFCFLLFIIFNRYKNRHYVYVLIILVSFLIQAPWLTSFALGFLICDIDYSTTSFKSHLKYIEKHILNNLITPIILCSSIIIISQEINFNSWSHANAIISFLLVFIIMKSKKLQELFQLRPILWLGKISFSVYLLHWPIICSITSYTYISSGLYRDDNIIISSITTIVSTLAVAFIYTKYVDQASIKVASKIGKIVVLFSEKIKL